MRGPRMVANKPGVAIVENEERERENRHALGTRMLKKGMGVRSWLLIDVKGSTQVHL